MVSLKKAREMMGFEPSFSYVKVADLTMPFTEVRDSRACELLRELGEMAEPTREEEYEGREFRVWESFYIPAKLSGFVAIPATLKALFTKDGASYLLELGDGSVISFREGDEREEDYHQLIEDMQKLYRFLARKGGWILEKLVPKDIRPGRILGKYVMEELGEYFMPLEKAKEIWKKYTQRKGEISEVSLRDYLETAHICYRALFENVPDDPRKAYEFYSDGRNGGMLEIEDENPEAFSEWLNSGKWRGSHPFEIVSGYTEPGLILWPPHEHRKKRYFLAWGGGISRKAYVKAVEALLDSGVPFDTGDLDKILTFLTGHSYIKVNVADVDSLHYSEIPREKRRYIEWDPLPLPEPTFKALL